MAIDLFPHGKHPRNFTAEERRERFLASKANVLAGELIGAEELNRVARGRSSSDEPASRIDPESRRRDVPFPKRQRNVRAALGERLYHEEWQVQPEKLEAGR